MPRAVDVEVLREEVDAARAWRPWVGRALAAYGLAYTGAGAFVLVADDRAEAVPFPLAATLGLITLGTGLAWLRWFGAVYYATRAAGRARRGAVATFLSWMLPVFVLVVPKLLVDEVWRAPGDGVPLPRVIRLWWALWWVSNLAWHVQFVLSVTGHADLATDAPRPEDWLTVLAVVPAILTVNRLTERLADLERTVPAPVPVQSASR